MVLLRSAACHPVGVALGFAGALALSPIIVSVTFHASQEPIVLVGVVAFMALIAAIATYAASHRATTVDPRTALQ